MDTQQFKYFLQLCVDRNYATASKNLYITQQALRKSMKRLELETHSTLFYKRGDSLELTKAGKVVKSHARKVINELESMEKSLSYISSDNNPVITIASSYGIYPRLANNLIIPFERKFPAVSLKIIELPDARCEDAILNGDADLGFCVGPNDSRYFDVYEIEVHDVCAMINKNNPLSHKKSITLEDLEGQHVAIVNDNFKLHKNFVNICEKSNIYPDIALNGGDVISVQNFSRFDDNIAVTVDFLAEDMGFDESVRIPMDVPDLNWTINMLVRKKSELSVACDEFVEFTKRTYREDSE
ncbi:MAG: LysR substrate-binding domain-containing protein [Coriobacteriales bacterium]|jgi:DNA-binding transcriptional LysR family regulator